MTEIKLTGTMTGALTIELPGLTAVRLDPLTRTIVVDGISGAAAGAPLTPGWTVVDLRDGTYGDFHRLRSAGDCFDADCAGSGQHDVAGSQPAKPLPCPNCSATLYTHHHVECPRWGTEPPWEPIKQDWQLGRDDSVSRGAGTAKEQQR